MPISSTRRGIPSSAVPSGIEGEQVGRVDGDSAIPRAPVQMRTGHAARLTDESDQLAARDGVSCRDELLAHMEVRGDDSSAVIDVHDTSGEIEIVDERDDATIRGANGIADRAAEIDAKMPARDRSIEDATGA